MAGKSGKSVDYKINLTFNTKDSDKQFQAVADRMREQIRAIATETNKTKYFTGLEQTIKDVDSQLDALRDKHGDSFDGLFGKLDDTTRQQFSSVFDYAKQRVEELKSEIGGLLDSKSDLKGILDKYSQYSKTVNEFVRNGDATKVSGFAKMDQKSLDKFIDGFKELKTQESILWNNADKRGSLEHLRLYVEMMERASAIKLGANMGLNTRGHADAAEYFLNRIGPTHLKDVFLPVKAEIDKLEDQIQQRMTALGDNISKYILSGGVGGSSGLTDLQTTTKLVELLIKRYAELDRAKQAGKTEIHGLNINDEIDEMQSMIEMLGKTDDAIERIENIILSFSDKSINLSEAIQQIMSVVSMPESSMTDGMDNVGKSAESAESKVKSLVETIQSAFNKATALEIDVSKGKSEGKEYMNLFGANGMVNEITGTDKLVDTDTIVSQLIANLKNDIVMSLHNHANGSDAFSVADIETFAKLYYGQGTKINGIIADGMIKTIDFTGISQELAIKIAQSYAEGLQKIASKNSNLLTYDNGKIGYTEGAKQLQSAHPDIYEDLILSVQQEVNQALNDAFTQNGLEPTIKKFEYQNIEELAQYLIEVQKNAQNAIDPVEKLKNLIAALHPDKTFDWNKHTSVLNNFSSGAIDGTKAISQILNLDSVGGAAEEVSKLDQYKAKLQEFNKIVGEINNHDYNWTAEDNVEIGKYTERLNAAKQELDALGAQAGITANELETVQDTFDSSMRKLKGRTVGYDSYYSGESYSYDYYDEYTAEQEKNKTLQDENQRLQEQLAKQSESVPNLAIYEDVDGQFALFDSIASSAQRATSEVEELEDAIKSVDNIDGQLSLFDKPAETDVHAQLASVEAQIAAARAREEEINANGNAVEQEITRQTIAFGGTKIRKVNFDHLQEAFDAAEYQSVQQRFMPNSIEFGRKIDQNDVLGRALFQMARFPEKYGGQPISRDKLIALYGGDQRVSEDFMIPLGNGTNITLASNTSKLRQYTRTYSLIPRVFDNDYKIIDGYGKYPGFIDMRYPSAQSLFGHNLEATELPVIKQANDDFVDQLQEDKEIGHLIDLYRERIPEYIDTFRPLWSKRDTLLQEREANDTHLQQLLEQKQNLEQSISAAEAQDVNKHTSDDAQADNSGLDNVSASAKQATEDVKELESALQRVESAEAPADSLVDGAQKENINDNSDVISQENEALREQVNLEQQVSSADQPKDTSDLQTIEQENEALERNNELKAQEDINANIVGPIENLSDNVPDETQKLFEDTSGQLAMFEGVTEEAQRAEAEVKELNDAIEQVAMVDGQIGFDDYLAAEKQRLEAEKQITAEKREQDSMAGETATEDIAAAQQELNLERDITTEQQKQAAISDEIVDNQPKQIEQLDIGESKISDTVVSGQDYALESTLQQTNKILNTIATKVGSGKQGQDRKTGTGTKKTKSTGSGKRKTSDEDSVKLAEAVSSKQTERNLQKIIGQVNLEKNDVGFNFYNRNLTEEQQEIVTTYDKLIAEIDKYEAAVEHGQQAELDGINEVKNALFAQIDAYKQKYNIAHGGKTGNKKAPGATAVISATTRYNALKNEASDERFAGSSVVSQSLEKYTDAYKRLVNLQSQYKIGQQLTGDQEQEFNSAKAACSKYASELDRLLKATKKFDGIAKVHNFADDFEDTDLGRQTAISDIVEQFYGAKVSAENFTDSFTKCVFTVDNGDGTFTKMTASLNAARNGINVFAGETKQATSAFGAFLNEVKGKFKSIAAYLISSLSFHEIWQVLKQGVTYVKEIDSALTELKKVTDETDASYDKFLQDMSKTGSVIGATVTNLTTMAADWARLGYSMEEAGNLAENTAILLNVSEFDDATAASEALISTMQAFQYTADESQHVVDVLNEVGFKMPNNIVICCEKVAISVNSWRQPRPSKDLINFNFTI